MPPTKLLSLILSFCLILEQTVFAQAIDLSHYFVRNSGQNIPQSDKFRPLHLRYISYDNQANDFKILLDKGDFFNQKTEKPKNQKTSESLNSQTPELENVTQELMKYFFIGLALPNEKFWVNLRPDSPDNILDPDLEKTDIGRIFLEADLQLKKDTASFTSPQNPEGKAYWDKLYKRAGELFGSENITIPTITRPWIVPNEIIIREAPDNAYIYKATLKVMLEEDYLKSSQLSAGQKAAVGLPIAQAAVSSQQYNFKDQRLKELNEYSTQLIKETIIPKLTYAVNTAKRYAQLRQVYYSLILAQWFKQKYSSVRSTSAPVTRAPVNSYVDLIDSGNLANLTSSQPYDKQSYFQQYQKSFKDGEYNLQEPVYTPMGQSIRRYMSGGAVFDGIPKVMSQGRVNSSLELSPALISKNMQMNISSPLDPDDISNTKKTSVVSSAVREEKNKNTSEWISPERYSQIDPKRFFLEALGITADTITQGKVVELSIEGKKKIFKEIDAAHSPSLEFFLYKLGLDGISDLKRAWIVASFQNMPLALFIRSRKDELVVFDLNQVWRTDDDELFSDFRFYTQHLYRNDRKLKAAENINIYSPLATFYVRSKIKSLMMLQFPKIWPPHSIYSVELLEEVLAHISEADKILVMGGDSGIIPVAITKYYPQQDVVVCDIDPFAIANIKANAELHGVKYRVRSFLSDVYNNIPPGEKYTKIIYNSGYPVFRDVPDAERIMYIGKNDYQLATMYKVLGGLRERLSKGGKLYLMAPSIALIENKLKEHNLLYTALRSFPGFNILEVSVDDSRPIDNLQNIPSSPSAALEVEDGLNLFKNAILDTKGGIDFNALPIQTESVASSALGALPDARAFRGDLDAEWARIQDVFNAGVRPSIQRLSEYTVAASASPLAQDRIDQVRVMLADILRSDEESQKLAPAEEFCKQLLRALEAG